MRKTKPVQVKHVQIGGGAPVAIQSMTKTDTANVGETVEQIEQMVSAGCEIVRLAVPDNDAAIALKEIRKRVPEVPLVADIHFHYKLALMALEAGIDKLRLNPGNIGKHERIVEVVRAAQAQKVPIRIGVNGGSLEKDLLKKYGTATPEAMVESAMRHIQIGKTWLTASSFRSRRQCSAHGCAYRQLAEKVDYPFHLGVTEAGTAFKHQVFNRSRYHMRAGVDSSFALPNLRKKFASPGNRPVACVRAWRHRGRLSHLRASDVDNFVRSSRDRTPSRAR